MDLKSIYYAINLELASHASNFAAKKAASNSIKFHFYNVLDFNGSLIFYYNDKVNFRVIRYWDQPQCRLIALREVE